MRLVRALIWMATLFFVAMLFVPLIQELFSRVGNTGQVP